MVNFVEDSAMALHNLEKFSPYMLAVLRIMTALLFVQHGLMKLIHFPAPQPAVADPLPTVLSVAAFIELVGGGLIAIGLFTRPAAFVASGMIAVGYFMMHAPRSFYPALNQGEPAILFCFVFLYLVFAGAGGWSLDAVRHREPAGRSL